MAFFFFVFSFGFAACLRAGSPSSPGAGFGVCLVLFFVCCGGCFFFFFSSFGRFAPFGWCWFFRVLRFSFRCSPSFGLGCGGCCRSFGAFRFLRLCWWFVWFGSCCFSCCFGFRCFLFRLRSWCVRCSFGCVGSLGCFGSLSALGLVSCGCLSRWARSFLRSFSLFLWAWFGLLGFARFRLRFGRSCFALSPCWGASSCWLGLFSVGRWFFLPSVVL